MVSGKKGDPPTRRTAGPAPRAVSASGSVAPRRVSARERGIGGTAPAAASAKADFLPGGAATSPHFKRVNADSGALAGKRRKREPGAPKRYTRRGKPRYGFFNYPRRQYAGFHRWVPSWRFLWWSCVAGVAAVVGGFMAAYAMIDLPTPSDFAQAQTSTVYYADGETVMGKFEVQNRQIIKVKDLPDYTRDAVVAAEDRTFRSNQGVDPVALARAFYNNLRGG
ncbi:MAG: transglycosylase domain-containing protein, partial [Bifidobacteriaceae bacterium]|nr:transglycosylase domain-containing protein [Bifidobacteriaceae bacterium]